MQKVKIMLAAITVLAAVGGALAFKARTFANIYCIGDKGIGNCPTGIITSVCMPNGSAKTYFYTTTSNISRCSSTVQCNKTGRLCAE